MHHDVAGAPVRWWRRFVLIPWLKETIWRPSVTIKDTGRESSLQTWRMSHSLSLSSKHNLVGTYHCNSQCKAQTDNEITQRFCLYTLYFCWKFIHYAMPCHAILLGSFLGCFVHTFSYFGGPFGSPIGIWGCLEGHWIHPLSLGICLLCPWKCSKVASMSSWGKLTRMFSRGQLSHLLFLKP